MTRVLTRALAVTALAALAACSGGGSALPAASRRRTTGAATVGHATLTITRINPATPTTAETAAHRSARELSSASNSVVVDSTQTGASPTHSGLRHQRRGAERRQLRRRRLRDLPALHDASSPAARTEHGERLDELGA